MKKLKKIATLLENRVAIPYTLRFNITMVSDLYTRDSESEED